MGTKVLFRENRAELSFLVPLHIWELNKYAFSIGTLVVIDDTEIAIVEVNYTYPNLRQGPQLDYCYINPRTNSHNLVQDPRLYQAT